MGVDSFKTDFGERIPTDVVYHDGSDPVKMHNYYTYLYNKVVFNLLKKNYGESKATLFARSATVGGQQFPVHWGGDCTSDFESMSESLRGGLSLCLSGFSFWSHDIGGFESTSTADVYKRWAAFGLLSTHSRLHGSSSYRVPWLYDEESCDVVRFFTKLKCSIMPYIFQKSCEAAKTGLPVMRAMVLEYGEDPATLYLDKQYMLGESLLVAPIFNEKGTVDYYLPKGTWTNVITNEIVEGGSWKNEKHGYLSLPLMARSNSIIAFGSNNTKPDYDYAENVTLHVFNLEEGKEAVSIVSNIEAKEELMVKMKRQGATIFVEAENTAKPWTVILRNIKKVKEVTNAIVEDSELGIKIIPNKGTNKIKIEL
jgi:alpha-D-xyloside xylohydrolase